MARKQTPRRFVMCINNDSYPASLDVRKVYASIVDAKSEAAGFMRVIDESGEDYLYPQAMFVAIDLPKAAADAVCSAAPSNAN